MRHTSGAYTGKLFVVYQKFECNWHPVSLRTKSESHTRWSWSLSCPGALWCCPGRDLCTTEPPRCRGSSYQLRSERMLPGGLPPPASGDAEAPGLAVRTCLVSSLGFWGDCMPSTDGEPSHRSQLPAPLAQGSPSPLQDWGRKGIYCLPLLFLAAPPRTSLLWGSQAGPWPPKTILSSPPRLSPLASSVGDPCPGPACPAHQPWLVLPFAYCHCPSLRGRNLPPANQEGPRSRGQTSNLTCLAGRSLPSRGLSGLPLRGRRDATGFQET